jgi:ABC-type sugar transport system permease subunit
MNRRRLKEQKRFIFAAIAPSGILLLVFSYFSLGYCIYVSLLKWNMLSSAKYIGMKNYAQLFVNPSFWNSLRVTLVYSLVSVPSCIILGLFVGLILKYAKVWRSFFRVMFFIPVIISMVVASLIWKWIFNPTQGILNYVLVHIGIFGGQELNHWLKWYNDPNGGALAALLVVGIWKRIGYNGVIFLAGLLNIEQQYYEAAEIEGASSFKQFWHITFPLLSPTTFFVLTMEIISALKVSVSPLVLTNGGPVESTNSLVLYIYKEAFENFRMGYASALAVIVFIFILIITVLQMQTTEKKVFYK